MRLIARTMLSALLAAPLGACGFDRYDGRWVADVGPGRDCCPTRIAMDIDGHKIKGVTEDCHGVLQVGGKIESDGTAHITVAGDKGTAHFAGESFDAVLPGDRCARHVIGNRGG